MSRKKWTFERIKEEALKYKSRKEFELGCPSGYNASRRLKCTDQVCSHMKIKRRMWTLEELQAEALKYSSRSEFERECVSAYNKARKIKVLDQICSHMRPKLNKWTFEKLQQEALKYESKADFYKFSKKAYDISHRRGIVNLICSHMKSKYNSWTLEKLQKEALKYKTRMEFAEDSKLAYAAGQRLGVLDPICSHMKSSLGSSLLEKKLFNKIKEIFPEVKTLKDRKAKIPGKPFIKGFDIDIYIPSLKKGVEFDGTYWHSFEIMKSGKPHWPEEDVRNYHSIKDNYFLEKGIDILHVNEVDWNKDPEKEIDRCLKFLQKE